MQKTTSTATQRRVKAAKHECSAENADGESDGGSSTIEAKSTPSCDDDCEVDVNISEID